MERVAVWVTRERLRGPSARCTSLGMTRLKLIGPNLNSATPWQRWGLFLPDVPGPITQPARRDDFLLGVKLDGFEALDVEIAVEGIVPAGEREHSQGRGDGDVDADHAGF